MKIFIPSCYYEDSFAANVVITLQSMGHEVLSFGPVRHDRYWSLPRYAARRALSALTRDNPERVQAKVVKVASRFKPQLLLSLTVGLSGGTLAAVKEVSGAKCVLWWGRPALERRRIRVTDPTVGFDVSKGRIRRCQTKTSRPRSVSVA